MYNKTKAYKLSHRIIERRRILFELGRSLEARVDVPIGNPETKNTRDYSQQEYYSELKKRYT